MTDDKDITDYIHVYAITHHGMPPSIVDVSEHFSMSRSGVFYRLRRIADRGNLTPIRTSAGVRYTSPDVARVVGRLKP